MTEAEKYLEEKEYLRNEMFNDEDFDEIWESEFTSHISLKELAEILKSYHAHKVASITDEMIDKQGSKFDEELNEYGYHDEAFKEGAKWFKQKLLNK